MKEVNQQSIVEFIYQQMHRLATKKITSEEAKAQALLAEQLINALKMYQ